MELKPKSKITAWLEQAHSVWFVLYASVCAFGLYTCVFSFRKTFSAATFDGMFYLGVSYKSWLVIAQVIGYGLAKFIGIKVISELKAKSRAFGILLMVSIAGISWLFFALVPSPYNIVFLFTNGLPLGMVWGMVFGYCEGRRYTEILGASLAVSFIFSAGFGKTVGAYLRDHLGVNEFWMPFTAALVFLLPLLLFLYLLNQLPPPSALDEQLRTRRQPMNADERKKFVQTFLPGIVLFVISYMLLTSFRDLRDNYSADVWKILGYKDVSIFTRTETPVSVIVLICMGSLIIIKNNHLALMINHLIIAIGMVMIGVATYLFQQQIISPPVWMILIGIGLYLGYIPFNSIFFDRLLAAFKYTGTVGFIMYVADSFGYLGSVGVVLFKEFGNAKVSWLDFFITGGYILSVAGTLLMVGSMVYFNKIYKVSKTL